MRIEDIEIHVGTPTFQYKAVRRLEAKCEATMAFSPAPTVEEMNGKLRTMAAKVGANAIVNVEYQSGASMTSWKSMKGTGLAVIKLSDDVTCPVCAESIKRAAIKCKHCGADVEALPEAEGQRDHVHDENEQLHTQAAIKAEPLRETNNPQLWLIIGAIVFVLLTIMGAASG